MSYITKRQKEIIVTIGYVPTSKRDGCGRCKFSKPEGTNSRLVCTRQKPMIVVNKLGLCNFYTKEVLSKDETPRTETLLTTFTL